MNTLYRNNKNYYAFLIYIFHYILIIQDIVKTVPNLPNGWIFLQYSEYKLCIFYLFLSTFRISYFTFYFHNLHPIKTIQHIYYFALRTHVYIRSDIYITWHLNKRNSCTYSNLYRVEARAQDLQFYCHKSKTLTRETEQYTHTHTYNTYME